MAYKHNVNFNIAKTYITSNKKLTMIASLGIVLGIAVYIFLNSMLAGFDKASNDSIFRSTPAVRFYKEDETSKPLNNNSDKSMPLIVNAKISSKSNTIQNPNELIHFLKAQPEVIVAMPQLNLSIFYTIGKTQIAGQAIGILPDEAQQMYSINNYVVEGSLSTLKHVRNGTVIGCILAKKLGVKLGDNVTAMSSKGNVKTMKVVGIFQMNNSNMDKSRSYINLSFAQEFLSENNSYITDINLSLKDNKEAKAFAAKLAPMTDYNVEDWEAANETFVAASKMRRIILSSVSIAIVIVAGFGIYNILNMTVSQKINDIAILKAMGFKGKDVVQIFVTQALIIGAIGLMLGVCLAMLFVKILSGVYVGGDIGFFPIGFDLATFAKGVGFGLIITFLAGYIPAKRAASVDPVEIFRK